MAYGKYSYAGPVMSFENVMSSNWQASTYAVSEQKARNNLAYRYRKEHGMSVETRLTLPGKITREEGDEY